MSNKVNLNSDEAFATIMAMVTDMQAIQRVVNMHATLNRLAYGNLLPEEVTEVALEASGHLLDLWDNLEHTIERALDTRDSVVRRLEEQELREEDPYYGMSAAEIKQDMMNQYGDYLYETRKEEG